MLRVAMSSLDPMVARNEPADEVASRYGTHRAKVLPIEALFGPSGHTRKTAWNEWYRWQPRLILV